MKICSDKFDGKWNIKYKIFILLTREDINNFLIKFEIEKYYINGIFYNILIRIEYLFRHVCV